MAKKTVIIGGVAGGATTAARLRRRDESMEIVVLEKGEYISYANCGLPYYIGDVITRRESLLLQTPEAMKMKFNVDVRTSNKVMEIHPEEKKILVRNVKTDEWYEESYDNLVLATGSSPIKPPIPGIDGDGIFTLWTVPDTDRIKAYIKEKKPRTAAVIGGGFIGLEMAENLHAAGLEVSIIEMQNQVMAPLDFEMANLIHENLRMNGVKLILGDGVKSFESVEDTTKITLSSGRIINADMVLLSIGVKPNSELAKRAGLQLNARGGVMVDEFLKTSVEDIYAVGDVTQVTQLATGEKTMIPLAGPANKQARTLADNLTGEHKKYRGSLGTAVAKVFDYDAASVGVNEKQLKAAGKEKNKDYYTVLINQNSHAGYYPGSTSLTLKLLFTPEGKILGGQIVGQDGVDKRMDTIATTLRLGGTIYDLEELELAYAPPFSSAKDPVNMLGFVAENVMNGMVSFTEWDEVDELNTKDEKKNDVTILDVREDVERMVYAIPNSYHIPLGQLRSRMSELDPKKQIIVYCAVGVRSYNAARILMQHGFPKVSTLSGGVNFYKSMHYEDRLQDVTGLSSNEENYEAAELSFKPEHEHKTEFEQHLAEKEEKKEIIHAAELKPNQQMKIIDCSGLQCPGPIMKVNQSLASMNTDEILQVSATDMGFANDIQAWCKRTGNTLVKTERQNKETIVYIKKGISDKKGISAEEAEVNTVLEKQPEGKTLIVFSGDLDKVLASFIIANGAAAMGRPVTMFFTFWGLNALRKEDGKAKNKPLIDQMFGKMMPKGIKKLKLSQMNLGGMGTAMMKKVMKDKNVNSLEDLMKSAMDNGVRLIACTMSMDVMGICKEELIDGIEYAGVASYLADAEESNVNLFIS